MFQLAMAVRDYECDMQGVVNNAVYQNYLEHTRHEFLKSRGLDFARLTEQGRYRRGGESGSAVQKILAQR